MANHVTNRITLLGNSAIKKLFNEMVSRFKIDLSRTRNIDDNGSIGRVLYGLKGEEAKLGYQETGANWVYVEEPLESDEPLRFISAWNPIPKLQDYILRHASMLDPNVIVINDYSEETARFIGCRIVTIFNGRKIEFIEHEDTSDITLVDDESDKDSDSMTWDEFWARLDELKLKLIDEIVEDIPIHTKEELLKLLDTE